MARAEGGRDRICNAAAFFFGAKLFSLVASIAFEIVVNGRHELTVVAVGFFFFQTASYVIRRFISKDPLLINTLVSLFHSSVISASGCTAGSYPQSFYTILILLVCFTLAHYKDVTINYLILSLVCELHSIFLHTRKVRRMAGVRDVNKPLVQLEWVHNWWTFFTARLVCHILITCKLIIDAHKFDEGIELPLALLICSRHLNGEETTKSSRLVLLCFSFSD